MITGKRTIIDEWQAHLLTTNTLFSIDNVNTINKDNTQQPSEFHYGIDSCIYKDSSNLIKKIINTLNHLAIYKKFQFKGT